MPEDTNFDISDTARALEVFAEIVQAPGNGRKIQLMGDECKG